MALRQRNPPRSVQQVDDHLVRLVLRSGAQLITGATALQQQRRGRAVVVVGIDLHRALATERGQTLGLVSSPRCGSTRP